MNGGVPSNSNEVEASLRAAIRLSPNFAPAYDLLAGLLAVKHANLDEAHILSVHAIELDPRNVAYRMNASSVLMTMSRYDDAASVLRSAEKVTTSTGELGMIRSREKQIASIQALGARPGAMITAPPKGVVQIETAEAITPVEQAPKHPTEPSTGAKHTVIGVIRGVACSYPAVLEFNVEGAKKPVSLYSNNYMKIDLSVLGFTPNGDMNPCRDFEGMKARVQYAETSDKTVDGQVVAVELRK